VYVTEDTGVGGGHRDIFEHLNGLADRGHEVALFTLGPEPKWFDLRVPVHRFSDWEELERALAPLEAIKIATWWLTGPPVWRASMLHGVPVFFVQDIETSYYADDERSRDAVLAGYRAEFRYMTISSWNRDRLAELGLHAELVPPGIDLEGFRPLERDRAGGPLLCVGRGNPLKNLPLTKAAWRRLGEARPELLMFGIEPELADEPGMRYVTAPSDAEVNVLFNECRAFVQTSSHEGFCLPPLEAMATGAAVVCTDAHGNRDFCVDGVNCLVPASDEESVARALERVLGDASLRERLGEEGKRTAAGYAWPRRLDELERFLGAVAEPRRVTLASGAVPEVRKAGR
jgi:glycosyltransferase involved in cell wall biosynthesis